MNVLTFRLKNETVNVGVFSPQHTFPGPQLPFFKVPGAIEAFNTTYGTGIRLVTATEAQGILDVVRDKPDSRAPFRRLNDFGVRTFYLPDMIAYTAPNKELGKYIRYTQKDQPTIFFPTGEYRGASNIALVVRDPKSSDFVVEKTGEVVRRVDINVTGDRLSHLENFPKKTGWYNRKQNSDGTIPIDISALDGEFSNGLAGVFFQRLKGSYIGMPTRYVFGHDYIFANEPVLEYDSVLCMISEFDLVKITDRKELRTVA